MVCPFSLKLPLGHASLWHDQIDYEFAVKFEKGSDRPQPPPRPAAVGEAHLRRDFLIGLESKFQSSLAAVLLVISALTDYYRGDLRLSAFQLNAAWLTAYAMLAPSRIVVTTSATTAVALARRWEEPSTASSADIHTHSKSPPIFARLKARPAR
jgi:hypothetical protein